MKQSSLAALIGRFSILLGGRLSGAFALFIANILIVRSFGAEALAEFAIFTSVVSLCAVILFAGFNSIASIFAAEYHTKRDDGHLKGFISRAIRNGVLATISMLLITLVYWIVSPESISHETLFFLLIAMLTAWGTALLGLNGAIQVGLKRAARGQLPDTLLRPFFLLVGIGLLIIINLTGEVSTIYLSVCAAVWLALLMAIYINFDFLKSLQRLKAQFDERRWLHASFPWMGITLVWDHLIDIVVLVASFLAGSVEIAVLHIAFRYRVLAGFGMRTIHTLYLPEITENNVQNNVGELRKKILQVNLASFSYSICVIIFFYLFGNWLFRLFTLDGGQGLPILIIVTLTMLTRAIFGPSALLLAIHNFHVITLATNLLGLVVTIVFIWFFFPGYGIVAAALAYSVGNFFVSLLLFLLTWKYTGINSSILPFQTAIRS